MSLGLNSTDIQLEEKLEATPQISPKLPEAQTEEDSLMCDTDAEEAVALSSSAATANTSTPQEDKLTNQQLFAQVANQFPLLFQPEKPYKDMQTFYDVLKRAKFDINNRFSPKRVEQVTRLIESKHEPVAQFFTAIREQQTATILATLEAEEANPNSPQRAHTPRPATGFNRRSIAIFKEAPSKQFKNPPKVKSVMQDTDNETEIVNVFK